MKTHLAGILLLFTLFSCTGAAPSDPKKFLDEVNDSLLKLNVEGQQAGWVSETFITDDTSAMNGKANQRLIEATERYAKDSVKFDKTNVADDMRRQLNLLKLA